MKKADNILSRLYLIFGAFILICYGSYGIKLITSSGSALPWSATILAITAVTVPFIFRKQLRLVLGKAYIYLKGVMCAGMILYFVSFISLVGYIYLAPVADVDSINPETERVYVVFGAKINLDGPSKTLASRLDKAAEALKADPNSICITTGGQGDNEHMTEGECMRDYLIALGIEPERIIAETEARNTIQNIKNSAALIEEMGLSDRDIICVSSDTHIPRIRLMCQREGIDAEYMKAETPKEDFLFATWVREHLSYFKMLVMGG